MCPATTPAPGATPSGQALGVAMRLLAAGTVATALAGRPYPERYDGDYPGNYDASSPTHYLLQFLKDRYYWSVSVPQDARVEEFASAEAALAALRNPADRRSFVMPSEDDELVFREKKIVAWGLAYQLAPNRQSLVVHHVRADSPAAVAGVARGDHISAIDGTPVATVIAENRLAAIFEPHTIGLSHRFMVTNDAGSREVMLRKNVLSILSASANDQLFQRGGRRIAYLNIATLSNVSQSAQRALGRLLAQGAQDIIVDVRRAGDMGFVDAIEIGGRLGPADIGGRIFLRRVAKPNGRPPENGWPYRDDQGAATPRFERVVWITGRNTCAMSEALVTGLDPWRRGQRIDETTCGDPVEAVRPRYNEISFSLLESRFENASALDWSDGLFPDCPVPDNAVGNPGSPEEALTAAALAWLETGSCPAVSEADRMRASTRADLGEITGVGPSLSRSLALW